MICLPEAFALVGVALTSFSIVVALCIGLGNFIQEVKDNQNDD